MLPKHVTLISVWFCSCSCLASWRLPEPTLTTTHKRLAIKHRTSGLSRDTSRPWMKLGLREAHMISACKLGYPLFFQIFLHCNIFLYIVGTYSYEFNWSAIILFYFFSLVPMVRWICVQTRSQFCRKLTVFSRYTVLFHYPFEHSLSATTLQHGMVKRSEHLENLVLKLLVYLYKYQNSYLEMCRRRFPNGLYC